MAPHPGRRVDLRRRQVTPSATAVAHGSLREPTLMLSCPGAASMPATTATSVINSLSKPSGGWRKKPADVFTSRASCASSIQTSSPNFLTGARLTDCATARNSRGPLFSCSVSPAPSTGKGQHCAHCAGQTRTPIPALSSERVLTDEFGAKRPYSDNWPGRLTSVSPGLCFFGLKSCVTIELVHF